MGGIAMELSAWLLLLVACLVYVALGVWVISAIFPALKNAEPAPDDRAGALTQKEPHP